MSYTPPESHKWIEFADAINSVEALPHDDQYLALFRERRVRQRIRWEQEQEDTFTLGVDELTKAISLPTAFLLAPKGEVTTFSEFTVSTYEAYTENILFGSLRLNNIEYHLSGNEELVLLTSQNSESISMTPSELSSILLLYAKQFYDDTHDYTRLSYLTDRLYQCKTDWDKLNTIISHMGVITGQSSRTGWSVIANSGDQIFVARLTEIEDPTENVVNHQVHLYQPTEFFTNETGLDMTRSSVYTSDLDEVEDDRAYSQASQISSPLIFARVALARDIARDKLPGAIFYEYGADYEQTRTYAQICQDFLSMLAKIRQEPL